ncbi:hypothetical protein PVIIG_05316 [Plasmodium vivax India VII]|uniref:Plasmodium RESA N-terminal domain-containing protein n=1 Tax=Plasmodium vivax India VII TaxID=1077284 RepID=A0A0J9S1W6_PLAVI|nr:hypothetical protein PVIIG_05316 [Plasmodium vivax India VII]
MPNNMDSRSFKREEYSSSNEITADSSTSSEIELIENDDILLSDADEHDYLLSEQDNECTDISHLDLTCDDEIIRINVEDEDFMSTDATMEYNEELEEITMNTMQVENMVGEVLTGRNDEFSPSHLNEEPNEEQLDEYTHLGNITQHDAQFDDITNQGITIHQDIESDDYTQHGDIIQHDVHSREYTYHGNIIDYNAQSENGTYRANIIRRGPYTIIEFDRMELHYNYSILKLWDTIKERRLGDELTNPEDLIEDKIVYHIYNFFHSLERCKYFSLKNKLNKLCDYIVRKYNVPTEVKVHEWDMTISYILSDLLKKDAQDYFELCDLIENGMCERLKFVQFINEKKRSWSMSTNMIFRSWADVLALKLIIHAQ